MISLVLRRVRLRAQRRAAWLRTLWAQEEAPQPSAITHAEMDTLLEDRDNPEAERRWFEGESSIARLNEQLAAVEADLKADTSSRLARLVSLFGLSDVECDLLQACLALKCDRSLGRVFAYLHDHAARSYVTEALVSRLFGHGRKPSTYGPASALRRWELIHSELVEPGQEPAIALDPDIGDWLRGRSHLDGTLLAVAERREPVEPLPCWNISTVVERLRRWLGERPARAVLVQVAGQPGSGRRSFAATVADMLGMDAVCVDATGMSVEQWRQAYVRATRYALLEGATLVWHGEGIGERDWPALPLRCPLQFVVTEPGETVRVPEGAVHHSLDMPVPPSSERAALWSRLAPAASAWHQESLEALAAQHRAGPGDIAQAALHEPATVEEAATLIRRVRRRRLGALAHQLETPFTDADLVVHDPVRRALDDLAYEASRRGEFWERPEARRLFPQGRGLAALLSGPPGTGKTMAAQVVASRLGLDLYRIDLSAVVSKYVGETSQNLSRVLLRARDMDVVLLFDEADALFGRRTEVRDAHDRFANTDTDHLLQAIEEHEGVVLLATNKKGDIDPAFLRRMRYVIEFSKPDAAQRKAIWRRVTGELVGWDRVDALGKGLNALAEGVEATGSEIKFAVLSAVFMAERAGAPISMSMLVEGLDRELGKSGRGISDREKERLSAHG